MPKWAITWQINQQVEPPELPDSAVRPTQCATATGPSGVLAIKEWVLPWIRLVGPGLMHSRGEGGSVIISSPGSITFDVDNPLASNNQFYIAVAAADLTGVDPGLISITAPIWANLIEVASISGTSPTSGAFWRFALFAASEPSGNPDPISLTVSIAAGTPAVTTIFGGAFEIEDSNGLSVKQYDMEVAYGAAGQELILPDPLSSSSRTFVIQFNDNTIGEDSDWDEAEDLPLLNAMRGYQSDEEISYNVTTSGAGDIYPGVLWELGQT